MNYTYLDCLAAYGVGGAHPGGLQLSKELLRREDIDESTEILDVGCGTGQTSAYITKEYGCSVTSLDCNKIMLEKAKQRFSALNLPIVIVEGNVENLPFSASMFDIVLSESVISFTNEAVSIKELKRVLKPDGVLIAIEMVRETFLSEEETNQISNFYGVTNLYTEDEWIEKLINNGFEHISIEKMDITDEIDIENATDFSLSEEIADGLTDVLEKHMHLTMINKGKLGYRVFRCLNK